jgi:hypothetical protein
VSRINESLRQPQKGRKEQDHAEIAVENHENDDGPDVHVDDQQEGDKMSSEDMEEEYVGPLRSLMCMLTCRQLLLTPLYMHILFLLYSIKKRSCTCKSFVLHRICKKYHR